MQSDLLNNPVGDFLIFIINWLTERGYQLLTYGTWLINKIAHAPVWIPIACCIIALFLFFSPSAISRLFALPYILVRRFLRLTGLVVDHRTWGVVYDARSKQPIDPAYLTIIGKLGTTIATAITDLDGRFGIVVPPGIYTLKVEKINYAFPSVQLAGKHTDGYYSGLYFGTQFEVTDGERAIAFAIPMDPTAKDWNQTEKKRKRMNAHDRKEVRMAAAIYFFVAGVFVYTQYILMKNSLDSGILLGYTGLLVVVVLYGIFAPRMYYHSVIIDKTTTAPIGFARVKVYRYESHNQVATKITSLNGQFICLIQNGMYYLTVEKRNDDGLYTLAYTSAPFRVVDRSINRQFVV